MDPDFIIRKACDEDIPHLISIEENLFASDRLSRRQMRYHIRNDKALFLTGLLGRQPVGYILLWFRENGRGRLYSLAVAAGQQGRGFGKALLERGFDAIRGKGVIKIGLEVDAADKKTISLYKKFGFREVARIPGYYEDGRAALKMIKDI